MLCLWAGFLIGKHSYIMSECHHATLESELRDFDDNVQFVVKYDDGDAEEGVYPQYFLPRDFNDWHA